MVEVPPCDGVRGEVNLEAPVEQESVPSVGTHAAADAVRRLEDGDLGSTFSKYLCAGEAGQAGPDDNRFHTRESVAHNSEDQVTALTRGANVVLVEVRRSSHTRRTGSVHPLSGRALRSTLHPRGRDRSSDLLARAVELQANLVLTVELERGGVGLACLALEALHLPGAPPGEELFGLAFAQALA